MAKRKRQRRRRLLDAALTHFFEHGYHATSVRSICVAARLSTRQFYELFDNREQLLAELYGMLTAEYQAAVLAAISETGGTTSDALDRGVRAMWSKVTGSPEQGYVLFVACVGVSPALERQRRTAVHGWAELIVDAVARTASPTTARHAVDARHVAVGVVGAANELFVDWIGGDGQMTTDELLAALLWVHQRLLVA